MTGRNLPPRYSVPFPAGEIDVELLIVGLKCSSVRPSVPDFVNHAYGMQNIFGPLKEGLKEIRCRHTLMKNRTVS